MGHITSTPTPTSYQTRDLNTGMPLVVNVTGPGSQFEPGYVVRWVNNGNAFTAGEGHSAWQSDARWPSDFLRDMNEHYWGQQLRDFVDRSHNPYICR
jgi:hypothetical protein